MPLVLIASTTSGAVTTIALGLATVLTATRTPTVLVEADPAGGVLSARHARPSSPGLLDLAEAARRDATLPLTACARPLRIGEHDVPTILAPASAHQIATAVTRIIERAPALLNPSDRIVIVDRGRLDPGAATVDLVRRADLVLMVVRAHRDDLARLWQRLGELRHLAGRVAVLLTPHGEYTAGEVARMLCARLGGQVVVRGPLPYHRAAARVLDGRHAAGRHFDHGRLLVALHDTATQLVQPLLNPGPAARRPDLQHAA